MPKLLIFIALTLSTGVIAATAQPVVTFQLPFNQEQPKLDVLARVQSNKMASISTDVGGQILTISEVGTQFKKGQVLVVLEDKSLHFEQQQISAEIEQSELLLSHLEKKLIAIRKLSLTEYSSRLSVDEMETEKLITQQKLHSQLARQQDLTKQLTHLQIKAPFDGVISQVQNYAGDFIRANQAVLTIHSTQVEAIARVTQSQAQSIHEGQQIQLLDGENKITALVSRIFPVADSLGALLEVRMLPQNPLPVGKLLTAQFDIHYSQPVSMIPEDALRIEKAGVSFVRVTAQHKAEVITTQIIDRYKNWIVIPQQINSGESLVIRGNESLKNGDAVQVVNL